VACIWSWLCDDYAVQCSRLAILPGLIPLIIYRAKEAFMDMKRIFLNGGLLVPANIIVLHFAIKLFKRERILTRWK